MNPNSLELPPQIDDTLTAELGTVATQLPYGELLVTARRTPDNPDGIADGMTFMYMSPLYPDHELQERLARAKQRPDYQPHIFVERNFSRPTVNDQPILAEEGETIDQYSERIRPLLVAQRSTPGANIIDIKHPFPLAGIGRFEGFYMWDSYQIAKGYAATGDWKMVEHTANVMKDLIEEFGFVPNGNLQCYTGRSQPPYFSHVVTMLAEYHGPEVLIHYRDAMEREYSHWMQNAEKLAQAPLGKVHTSGPLVRLADGSMLNRYWDAHSGPRPESQWEDIELGNEVAYGLEGDEREARLARLYKDLRAGAATGWDYTSRIFADGKTLKTINTTSILPVDLNSLMRYTEETLALSHLMTAEALSDGAQDKAHHIERALFYEHRVRARDKAMNTHLLDPTTNTFGDYNFREGRLTGITSSAMAYPMYVGMTTETQSLATTDVLERDLLQKGGILVTNTEGTGQQWDSPNVWMPPSWAAIRGAARMAYILRGSSSASARLLEFSEAGRAAILDGIQACFDVHRFIPEKINGFDPRKLAGGGEYDLVKVLNMTVEGRRALSIWNPREPLGCLPVRPIGQLIVANSEFKYPVTDLA